MWGDGCYVGECSDDSGRAVWGGSRRCPPQVDHQSVTRTMISTLNGVPAVRVTEAGWDFGRRRSRWHFQCGGNIGGGIHLVMLQHQGLEGLELGGVPCSLGNIIKQHQLIALGANRGLETLRLEAAVGEMPHRHQIGHGLEACIAYHRVTEGRIHHLGARETPLEVIGRLLRALPGLSRPTGGSSRAVEFLAPASSE